MYNTLFNGTVPLSSSSSSSSSSVSRSFLPPSLPPNPEHIVSSLITPSGISSSVTPYSSKRLYADYDYMTNHYLGQYVPVHFGGSGRQAKKSVMNCISGMGPYGRKMDTTLSSSSSSSITGGTTGNNKIEKDDGKKHNNKIDSSNTSSNEDFSSSSFVTVHKPDISFNKYSGVQFFQNGIVLFINLFGTSNDFFNEVFIQNKDTVIITWYASDRMHDHHPTVLELIHHQHGATKEQIYKDYDTANLLTANENDDDDDENDNTAPRLANNLLIQPRPVGLAVRLDTEEPYIWCGTLQYVKHIPKSHPVKFEFLLTQYNPTLQELLKKDKKLPFQKVIDLSKPYK